MSHQAGICFPSSLATEFATEAIRLKLEGVVFRFVGSGVGNYRVVFVG